MVTTVAEDPVEPVALALSATPNFNVGCAPTLATERPVVMMDVAVSVEPAVPVRSARPSASVSSRIVRPTVQVNNVAMTAAVANAACA